MLNVFSFFKKTQQSLFFPCDDRQRAMQGRTERRMEVAGEWGTKKTRLVAFLLSLGFVLKILLLSDP